MENKKKYDFIDLIKSIAIFFVLLYHFNNASANFIRHESWATYLNYLFRAILSTCVPLFFFVNGALLLNRKKLDVKKHTLKIIRIAILTMVWGIITLIILSLLRGETLSFLEIVKGIYFLKQGYINHLWFLEAIIVIYIFYPLFLLAFKYHKPYFYFFLGCAFVLTFGNTLLQNFAIIFSSILNKFANSNFRMNFFSDFNALKGIYGYSIVYFLLGGLFFSYKEELLKPKYRIISITLLIIATLLLFLYGILISKRQNDLWDIVWNGYDTVFTLISVISISTLSLTYRNKGKIGSIIQLIGENSLGIYFIHIIIGTLIWPYFTKYAISQSLFANIIFTFCLLTLCLFSALGLKKTPILNKLLSIN